MVQSLCVEIRWVFTSNLLFFVINLVNLFSLMYKGYQKEALVSFAGKFPKRQMCII